MKTTSMVIALLLITGCSGHRLTDRELLLEREVAMGAGKLEIMQLVCPQVIEKALPTSVATSEVKK